MTTDHATDVPDLDALTKPVNRMEAILNRYLVDRRTLERKYPVQMSEMCRNRMRRFLSGWQIAIEKLPLDNFCKEERIDCTLFDNHLKFSLRKLQQRELKDREIAPLLPFANSIIQLEEARIRMEWANAEECAATLHDIGRSVTNAQELLVSTANPKQKWKRTVANRAAETIENLLEVLKNWYAFYSGFDPLVSWWAESPYQAAASALEGYRDCIRRTMVDAELGDSSDIIGDPIGADQLAAELAFEMIPYSPEELIEIAQQELAWCESEMAAAAAELGFGDDTKAALEHVKVLYATPGGQPELVKALALEAIDFLDEHDLLTVPSLAREAWRLEMMSAEMQKVNPFFLGGEIIMVSSPTNTMSHEEKRMSLRGNNAHFARATVQHELIPGHHIQSYTQERYHTYRRPFHTPFWIEGWTIYWEFLLYKMGFAKTPENRIGMLFWRRHRCARIVFSLSFHLEKMTPQECVEMLVERVGHERANAVAEVRRSCGDTYPPLYQCAYLIGGLQMWALRKELVDSGKMPEREFHDAVLQQNCIPIEMVRADLINQELTNDFVSNWRFYGELA